MLDFAQVGNKPIQKWMKQKTKRAIIFLFLRKKCSIRVTFKGFFFFSLLKGEGGIYREFMKHGTSSKTFGNMSALLCYFTHPFLFCFSPFQYRELYYELIKKHGSYKVFLSSTVFSTYPTWQSHKKYDTVYWATIDIGQSTIRSIMRVLLIPHYLLSKHTALEIRNRGSVCVCICVCTHTCCSVKYSVVVVREAVEITIYLSY